MINLFRARGITHDGKPFSSQCDFEIDYEEVVMFELKKSIERGLLIILKYIKNYHVRNNEMNNYFWCS
jgi:hypothetical protein